MTEEELAGLTLEEIKTAFREVKEAWEPSLEEIVAALDIDMTKITAENIEDYLSRYGTTDSVDNIREVSKNLAIKQNEDVWGLM